MEEVSSDVNFDRSRRSSAVKDLIAAVNYESAKKWPQIGAAMAASTGAFVLGMGIGFTSPTEDQLVVEESGTCTKGNLCISSLEWSFVGSLLNLGALFGGLAGGTLYTKFGVSHTAVSLALVFTLGYLLIAFAQDVAMMIVGRLLIGFAGGCCSLFLPIYTSDYGTPNMRGMLGTGFQVFVCSGIFLAYCIGPYIPWYWLAIASAATAALFLIGMIVVPDSPLFLLSKGRDMEAKKALLWFRGETHNVDLEIDHMKEVQRKTSEQSTGFKDLFVPSILKPVGISLALMAAQQFSGNNAAVYNTVSIFKAANAGIDKYISAIVVGGVQAGATIISSFLVERLGRKVLLLGSSGVCSLTMFALGSFFYLKNHGADQQLLKNLGWLPLTSLILYIAFFSFGIGPLPWMMMAEFVPSRVLGLASSIAIALNWGLAFLVTLTFSLIVENIGEEGAFWLYGSCTFVSFFFCLFVVPETKGKSLQEIQELFQ